jgi:hypothetical protein
MKSLFHFLVATILSGSFLAACNRDKEGTVNLKLQIDSLRLELKDAYKPGTGELMSNIQLHHIKLWFAGKNANWPLAEYNESLIRSAFKKLQIYHGGTFEATAAAMIDSPLDSLTKAIAQKDSRSFEKTFVFLTTTCNNCHAVTKHPFNVITVPTIQYFSDQDFKAMIKK